MSAGHKAGGRKHKGGHDEEHENHERWLVSYADMMTLLMVLFIVLFAISSVDQKKFNELKSGLAVGFGSESAAFTSPGDKTYETNNEGSPMDVAAGATKKETVDDEALKKAVSDYDRARQYAKQEKAQEEVSNLEEIQKQILAALEARGMADKVRFAIDERGLVVTIVTSAVVFGGDRADLLTAGREILDAIGPTLVPLPNRIEVDGHTNQLPVQTVNYPSGWELSSARAASVVRYLHDRHGLPEQRMLAAGFADTRPLYPPGDARAVTHNRRVEIIVLSTLPADERALLPSAAAGKHE